MTKRATRRLSRRNGEVTFMPNAAGRHLNFELVTPVKIHPKKTNRLSDDRGATSLEWALALGALAVPFYIVIQIALSYLVDLYRAQTTVNGLPLP